MIKLNPKVYDLIDWLKKNFKTNIVWYLKNIISDILTGICLHHNQLWTII